MQQFRKIILATAMAAGLVTMPAANVAAAAAPKAKPDQPVDLRNGESIGDVAMPAGALIDTKKSMILGNGSNAYGKIYVKVKADQMKVADFFKNNMPNEGWGLISEAQDDDIMLTFQKPTRVATIRIERGSTVKLTVVVTPRN